MDLQSLESYLRLVKEEESLQTKAVEDAVGNTNTVCKDLELFLIKMCLAHNKSKGRQFAHNFMKGEDDEKELEGIGGRLNSARLQLSMNIQLVHVSVTGSVQEGIVAVMSEMRRVNGVVQRVLNEGLKIARLLENRPVDANGMVPLTGADIKELGIVKEGDMVWSNNLSFGQAKQLNAPMGKTEPSAANRKWDSNKAFGKSRQLNGPVSADAGLSFFTAE